jgi:hypothetical protein
MPYPTTSMKPLLVLAAALALPAFAEPKPEFWPGAAYDPSIPTQKQVLGYEPGERISSHANLLKYLEALAAAAPARMKIFDYAKTWENRRLVYAVIGSEANMRRIEDIKGSMKRLADPRRTNELRARSNTSHPSPSRAGRRRPAGTSRAAWNGSAATTRAGSIRPAWWSATGPAGGE